MDGGDVASLLCVGSLSKFFSPSPPLLIDFFRKKGCPLFASTFPCRPPVGIEKYKKKASLSSLQLPLQNPIVVVVPCLVVLPSFPFSLVSVCLVPHTNSTPPSPLSPKNNNPPPSRQDGSKDLCHVQ